MRAPLSWIREFTPLDAPVSEIADALNQLGLEVEEIDEPGAGISGVITARILDVVPHPDADKIRLADIDFGDGQIRVVCGAPNIAAGMVVPFATVGARLPGGFEITKRKIRGVVSEGMLCSSRELGLGEDHSGILALPAATPLGADVREVLGLNDVVFDLSITPNRPDAMGVVGVARELAAHFGLPFDVPSCDPVAVAPRLAATTGTVEVDVEVPGRCPRFVARVATVRMGESPEWMQRRLILAGMRPISNVVDVTNYVMLERCRPLHAFDLAHLAGPGIVVRLARDGEQIVTLDGVTRTLSAADLLICDAERTPQAIAGIMGAAQAEVGPQTTEILIESAYFEPGGISKSSKRLGLRSEASARFERGIDPNGTDEGAHYALRLLSEVAAAEALDGMIDVYPEPVARPRVTVRTDRVNRILGTELAPGEVRDLLEPLGITTDVADQPGAFVAECPTWRPDLEREIDLVEEVARRYGLHRIRRTVASAPAGTVGRLSPAQRDRRRVADALVGAGLSEGLTMPLVARSDLERCGLPTDTLVSVTNPLRAEESVLRTSLRPGLIAALARNTSRGNGDVALFEMGRVFLPPTAGSVLPTEREHVAAVMVGARRCGPQRPDRAVEVTDALDAVHALVEALGLADVVVEAAAVAGFHPSRAAVVRVDGSEVGAVGEIAPAVARDHDLSGAVVGFELDLDALCAASRRSGIYQPVSGFPAANVDLAFVVDDTLAAAALEATLRSAAGDLLERIALFDVFRSDALGPGRVSLAFGLRLRAADRTLTDDDVAGVRNACIESARRVHGAELRG